MVLAAAFNASAATYDLGTLDPTATDYSSGFSGKFAKNALIDDYWTFTLDIASDASFGALQTFTTSLYAISNFAAEIVGVSGSNFTVTTSGSDVKLSWAGALEAGTYSVHVTGKSLVGNTQYVATVSATPVPEPETYALMLGGLALVGSIARRRKNQA